MRAYLACLFFLMFLGCNSSNPDSGAPGNYSEFNLVNNSTQDLLITASPCVEDVMVESGGNIMLCRLDSDNDSFPGPADKIEGVFAAHVQTGSVLYEQIPIRASDWTGIQTAIRVMHFTLVIEDSMLAVDGVQKTPPRLSN